MEIDDTYLCHFHSYEYRLHIYQQLNLSHFECLFRFIKRSCSTRNLWSRDLFRKLRREEARTSRVTRVIRWYSSKLTKRSSPSHRGSWTHEHVEEGEQRSFLEGVATDRVMACTCTYIILSDPSSFSLYNRSVPVPCAELFTYCASFRWLSLPAARSCVPCFMGVELAAGRVDQGALSP